MAEWIYEDGIGEARAALVAHGRILEMAIDRDDGRLRCGTVLPVRIARARDATGRALARFDGGSGLIEQLPPGVTEGATLTATVVREAIDEGGTVKPARLRPSTEAPRPGATLRERLAASPHPIVPLLPHQPDALEAAGWSEALEEAASGVVARDAAMLRIVPTPAMTVIDVDGALPPAELARAGARLAGEAIRCFDIGGSIGIDLPTLADRALRQATASALDQVLPQPFERTAVNGFGFLQIVRRRQRASLLELLQHDRATAAALALLRTAERSQGAGTRTLEAHPAVIARITPAWTSRLGERLGTAVALRGDPARAISGGHVAVEYPR